MAASIPSTHGPPHARKPLASQRSAGGDMSIAFFVQPGCPSRFASSDQHRVKGLNAETIAKVILPTPPWLTALDYSPLRADPTDPSPSIFFSLNLSIYNQHIVPEDWFDQWFLMAGRVHPFALTWEVERQDGLEESVDSGLLAYTIPALIVRDQGYQPFTGPVVGPGPALLHKESVPALDDVQLKCCGFVQLTTFLAPGNPDKTPYRGFHPFQVFVIFPIRANPWASLCKKMAERRDTQFQSNVLLTCTGKVAGLLGHHLMVQPPTLEQDYVFIVVPDSWTFLDKGVSGSGSPTPPSAATSAVRSSSSNHTPFEEIKAKFTARRPAAPPTPLPAASLTPASTPGESIPSVTSTPSTQYHYLPASPTPMPKRPASGVDYASPAKRPRQSPTSPIVISSSAHPSAGSSSSQETVDEPGIGRGGNQAPVASFMRHITPTTHPAAHVHVLDTITASVSEPSNRPSRSRHPPKNKYLEEVSKV
ncbi:hypothetical protein AUP68_11176 [Ilyonectria robusta]